MNTVSITLGVVALLFVWVCVYVNAGITAVSDSRGNRWDRLSARVLFGKGPHKDLTLRLIVRGNLIGVLILGPLFLGLERIVG